MVSVAQSGSLLTTATSDQAATPSLVEVEESHSVATASDALRAPSTTHPTVAAFSMPFPIDASDYPWRKFFGNYQQFVVHYYHLLGAGENTSGEYDACFASHHHCLTQPTASATQGEFPLTTTAPASPFLGQGEALLPTASATQLGSPLATTGSAPKTTPSHIGGEEAYHVITLVIDACTLT